ncbi:MAG: UPF0149 family protein [Desulfovibrio sp.]
MQLELTQPLSSEELDKLEASLARHPHSMTLEMLDGFFAALVCSPELVMPSTYMPYVLGDDDEKMADLEDVQTFYQLVMRHWNSVAHSLNAGKPYDMVLVSSEDKCDYGNDWAVGFLQGVQIGGEDWDRLIEDDDNGGIFVPIFALVHEHDPDPDLRPEPISEEQRNSMLASISALLPSVYKYFEAERRGGVPQKAHLQMPVRKTKIGRNDPCPCGSNRKYKHCCGSN